MSRRCMPSECPRQTVTALITRKTASAIQLNKNGPPTRPTRVMVEIQIDLSAFQRTTPSTASVSSASTMRGERNVLSERCSASSTASKSYIVFVAAADIAMVLLHQNAGMKIHAVCHSHALISVVYNYIII